MGRLHEAKAQSEEIQAEGRKNSRFESDRSELMPKRLRYRKGNPLGFRPRESSLL
jgi:hypothetical protein